MKITKINMINLDKLFQIVYDKETDENYGKNMFSNKIAQLYSHIEISYEIEDISIIEYVFMKMFSSRITKFEKYEDHTDVKLSKDLFPALTTVYGDGGSISFIDNLFEFFRPKNTGDYNHQFSLASPIGFKYGSCITSFTGRELINIIGMDPKQFFVLNSDLPSFFLEPSDDDKERGTRKINPSYDYQKDKTLVNSFVSILLKEFYKFMVTYCTNVDLPSEVFMKRFNYVSEENCSCNPVLSTFKHPLVTIDYQEDKTEDIIKKVDEFQSLGIKRFDHFRTTEMVFSFCTPFVIFCKLFEVLPKGSITSMDNFLEVNQKGRNPKWFITSLHALNSSDTSKMEDVFEKELQKFIKKTVTEYDNSENILNSILTTMSYAPISFSVSITEETLYSLFSNTHLDTENPFYNNLIYFIINKMKRFMEQTNQLLRY